VPKKRTGEGKPKNQAKGKGHEKHTQGGADKRYIQGRESVKGGPTRLGQAGIKSHQKKPEKKKGGGV